MANDDSTQYAPGVTCKEHYRGGVEYFGFAEDLVACGLIKAEWLPGVDGYGKTMRNVIFDKDGVAIPLGSCKGGKPKHDFGGVRILKLGKKFLVVKLLSIVENQQLEAEKERERDVAVWNAAKKANEEGDYPQRWRDGVLHCVDMVEQFVDGRRYFTDFPDIALSSEERIAALNAVSELKRILHGTSPAVPRTVVRSNVIALNAATFRRMQH